MIQKLIELDTSFFLFLNSFNSIFFDKVMWFISGKYEWIPLYVVIIYFIFKKFKKEGFLILIFIIISISLADLVSVHLFKEVFQRLRPCHYPNINGIVHTVNNYCGGKYGFVSSHAANSFAIATFTTFLFKNKYFTYGIYFWAIIVSYSRIYLGVHYPFDILGGAILGFVSGFLLILAFKKIEYKFFISKNNLNG